MCVIFYDFMPLKHKNYVFYVIFYDYTPILSAEYFSGSKTSILTAVCEIPSSLHITEITGDAVKSLPSVVAK